MVRASRLRPRLLAGLLMLCFGTAGVNAQHPRDPLSASELERLRAAESRNYATAAVGVLDDGSERSTGSALDRVLLLIERAPDKNATRRTAHAYYYDYSSDELLCITYDVESTEVLARRTELNTQLPLVDIEISRAFDLVMADPEQREALRAHFQAVTGQAMLERSDVQYKAFVFHADTVVDGLVAAARRCGTHRCAQLLFYTKDNAALEYAPIVDLSKSSVLQNMDLRARELGAPGRTIQPHEATF